jgi:hypothetical protein
MRIVIVLLIWTGSINSFGQVRYSDLNVLLKAGNFKQAEPYLKSYLKSNKNNPSAHIYMGRIFEASLTSSNEHGMAQSADSALLYYTLAKSKLTQSIIDKNEEYYSQYSRRDLRTGKFEVKLPDIILDLDIRCENLSTLKRAMALPVFQEITNQRQKEDAQPAKELIPLRKEDGKYFAVIVGISKYDSSNLDLDKPVKDALEMKNILTKNYEFDESNVYVLLNPTRQQIILSLYSLRKKITPIDNLLIFYAGHGYWDSDANQGYWWPRDASPVNPTNWLSNSDIREQIRGIKTAHTLLISDACFSGGIFKARGASSIREATLDIVALYKIPSRRAMTSGTLTEVPDKSVFFEYLSKRLTQNTERFLTSQALFDSFKKAVINNSLIVPQDGVIADTGDEGGDFVFIKRKE